MDTKTALLNHAEALVRTRGMDAFSFADLAHALEIKKASVHYHFPTKADLVQATLQRYAQNFLDALPMEGTAADRLAAYLEAYANALGKGEQVCLCVSLTGSRTGLPDNTAEALDAFNQTNMAWLHGVFVQGKRDGTIRDVADEVAEARQCLALVEGAQLVARAEGSTEPFHHATALLRGRLIFKET